MYPALFFGDVLLILGTGSALLVAALLVGRAARRRPGAGTVAALFVLACVPAVALRVGLQLGLASYGPEFARDHLAIGVPLALVPLAALLAVPRRGRTSVAGTVAVRTAAVAPVLSWHFVFVPPGSVVTAALGYAAVLAVVAALLTLGAARPPARSSLRALRLGVGSVVAVAAMVAVVGWSGRVAGPGTDYAALAGTPVDAGGGPVAGHDAHLPVGPGVRSIADLRGPSGTPDARFTLTARVTGDRWTYDGRVPGPELRVTAGQLVEVTLVNRDVPAGVTLHWHGVHVPNAEDGVAGVTQDAVKPGGRHVYRFRPEQAGTFWYHSHQQSSEGVVRGLAGALVVLPRSPAAGADLVVVDHPEAAAPPVRRVAAGTPVRLRIVNADQSPRRYQLAGTPFRVVAIDGVDLTGPGEVRDTAVRVAAGGRYDLAFAMPAGGVSLTGGVHDVELSADGGGGANTRGGAGPADVRDAGGDRPRAGVGPRLHDGDRPAARVRCAGRLLVLDGQRAGLAGPADVHRPRGRRRADPDRQPVHRGPPDAPARAPLARAVPRRGPGHREPVVDGHAERGAGGDVRGRVPGGQPGDLDGPLPRPAARPGRVRVPPGVRGLRDPVPARRRYRERLRVAAARTRPGTATVARRAPLTDTRRSRTW